MASVNDYLLNERVDRGATLDDYKASTVKSLVPLLQDMADDVRATLNSSTITAYQERRVNALLNNINKKLVQAYKKIGRELSKELENVVKAEITYSAALLNESVGVAFAARPTINQVFSAAKANPFNGRPLQEYYDRLPFRLGENIAAQIRIGYSVGEATATIQQRINPILRSDSFNWTETLTRDAVSHFQVTANRLLYEANSDALKGVKWDSTLDTSTTDICANNDGRLFAIEDMGRIPAHFRCRSDWVPVLKSWKAVNFKVPNERRQSMDGLIPADQNYSQWFAKQPLSRQQERLGIAGAKLYREGGLPLDKFSSRLGDRFTLDELKSRHPAKFADVLD